MRLTVASLVTKCVVTEWMVTECQHGWNCLRLFPLLLPQKFGNIRAIANKFVLHSLATAGVTPTFKGAAREPKELRTQGYPLQT